jgi:hypothetical protein
VPEVQWAMRLCNEFEMPVSSYSIGRNTGYGVSVSCSLPDEVPRMRT